MQSFQEQFSGGQNLIVADTSIAIEGYKLLVNGRNRFGQIEAIKAPEELTLLPDGLRQGGASIGNVFIVFIAGCAYYKFFDEDTWYPIVGFSMSSTVEQYYCQVVPQSNFNFVRKLSTSGSVNSEIVIDNSFIVAGTPSGLVVQDGINQPWIIFYDWTNNLVTARVTKTYADWANVSAVADDREYVPIGKQMMVLNGKLFIVSPDGTSVYHSVTGRFLDFVINITPEGEKLATESQGGAPSTSFAFDYNQITCLHPTSITDTFIYATATDLRLVVLDYTNTLFGEPTFKEAAKVSVGVVNQFSVEEVLGDYAIIDFEGVTNFNAVRQLKVEGRNSPFSIQISRVLKDKRQSKACCVSFDNYLLFSLDTNIGSVIAVYDSLLNKWASFDITEAVRVKQFIVVEDEDESKIYAITADKVFELFSSEDVAQTTLFTRAWKVSPKVEHKGQYLRLIFCDSSEASTVRVMEFVDDRLSSYKTVALVSNSRGVTYPVIPPVVPSHKFGLNNVNIPIHEGLAGHKISFAISWKSDAKLNQLELMTSEQNSQHSLQQGAAQLA